MRDTDPHPHAMEPDALAHEIASAPPLEHAGDTRNRIARLIVDHMHQFVALLDASGTLIDVNRTALEAGGIEPDEVLGRPFWEGRWWSTTSATRRRLRAAIERALKGELVRYDVDVYGTDAGRTVVPIDFSIKPLRDGSGRVVFLLAEGREIAAKKKAEAELRRLRQRYELILTTADDGIYGLDLAGNTTFVNPAATRLVGFTADEMLGRRQHDLVHHHRPDGTPYPVAECRIYASMRDGTVHRVDDEVFWRRDGSSFPVEYVSAPIIADGEITGAVVTFRDVSERRRAEAELRESEERFRAIFERAGIGIALVDPDGRSVASNRMLQQMLDYTADQLRGMSFTEFTHPDDIAIDRKLYDELLAGDRDSYRIEKRYIRGDGRLIWGRLTVSVVRDAEGRPRFGIGMVEDVTDRREAEESRSRLVTVLEATPDFVGITDAAGTVLYLNRGARELVGLSATEARHLSIPDFHPAWAASRVLDEGLPSAFREGSWSGETAVLTRDGREIPVSQVIITQRDDRGEVGFIATIMRDISERKRAERAQQFLLHASRVLSGSLDPDAIAQQLGDLLVPDLADYVFVDLAGDDARVRRVAAVHRDPGMRGLMERLLTYPPRVDEGRACAERVLRTGRTESMSAPSEEWLLAASRDAGHRRLLEELAPAAELCVPLTVRDRVIGVITFGFTTSDRGIDPSLAENLAGRTALALENARLYREAREAARIRDEVLRVVAHDLRNPLNNIAMSAELLRQLLPEQDADPGRRRQLDIISRSVHRADRLIRDLLDVAQLGAGRLSIETAPHGVKPLVHEAVELHRAFAERKSLRITAELPEELPDIVADRDRIIQVFTNLIGNAIKFTPEGGSITLRAAAENGAVRFSVGDTGPGIPDEDQPHLFDAFWQARRDASQGAGLGLAIARGIVEAHGGSIWVESEVSRGATFHFTIPRTAPSRDTAAATP